MSKLFTTSVGDVAVTAEGDPVGLLVSSAQPTVTITSPVSAERPIYRVSPQGIGYVEFLPTSRVTLDFGAPFVGAMFVTTLAGSYVVEIDTPATFVWGAYMPVRNILGLAFIEGFDINSQEADNMLAWMVEDRQGQLDWDENRTDFDSDFRQTNLSSFRSGMFDSLANSLNSLRFIVYANRLRQLPARLSDTGIVNPVDLFWAFGANGQPFIVPSQFFEGVTISRAERLFWISNAQFEAGVFDSQTQCTNYTDAFSNTGSSLVNAKLTPQSVENVLVSINVSAANNNLLNGSLGIRGDANPLTTDAEAARQSLLAKGWTLTLDNITGL